MSTSLFPLVRLLKKRRPLRGGRTAVRDRGHERQLQGEQCFAVGWVFYAAALAAQQRHIREHEL
jgi:hypothetical protein